MLVNPNLGGVTLGWNLNHDARDELFAAIEGTAFHTRIILERMAEHGVPIRRVINAGGIPQKNAVLNQVYANVLGNAGARAGAADHKPRLGDLRVSGGRTFSTRSRRPNARCVRRIECSNRTCASKRHMNGSTRCTNRSTSRWVIRGRTPCMSAPCCQSSEESARRFEAGARHPERSEGSAGGGSRMQPRNPRNLRSYAEWFRTESNNQQQHILRRVLSSRVCSLRSDLSITEEELDHSSFACP